MADSQTITMRQPTRDSVAGYQFDAVISEQHGQRLTVTKNPIETGVSIADHCFVEGATLTIVGSVSDMQVTSDVNMYDSSIGRSNDAYQLLCDLETQLATKVIEPFQIVTSVKVYDDMVMTEIEMQRDKQSSRLGRFQMRFEQLIRVDTVETDYQALAATGRSVAPKNNGGNQQGGEPKPDDAAAANKAAAQSTLATLGKTLSAGWDKLKQKLGGGGA